MVFKRIARNFSVLVIAQFIYKALNFVTYILIARFLGVNGFGRISFVITFVWFFNALVDGGLKDLFVREASGKDISGKRKYAAAVLGLRITLSAIMLGLVAIFSLTIPYLRSNFSLNIIVALALAFYSFTYFARSVFQAFEKMEYEAISMIIEAAFKISVIFIILKWTDLGILGVAQGILYTSFVTALFSMIICQKKFITLHATFSKVLFVSLLQKSMPFLMLTLFCVINFKIDIIMVSWMLGDRMAGLFSAAVRIVEPMLTFPFLAVVVLFPVMSRLSHGSIKDLRRIFYIATRFLFLMGIIMSASLFFIAPYIVSLLFSKEFLGSIFTARILSFCLIPFCLKFFLDRFLLVIRRTKIMLIIYALGTSLNVLLNLYLIPNVGYAGAAISTLFSEFTIVVLSFYWIRKYIPETSFFELKKEPATISI